MIEEETSRMGCRYASVCNTSKMADLENYVDTNGLGLAAVLPYYMAVNTHDLTFNQRDPLVVTFIHEELGGRPMKKSSSHDECFWASQIKHAQ